ncbi:hypothetical protein ACOTHJ_15070 [Achromobacter xylosoxidans]
MSWTGIKVRHADGRTGRIRSDYEGFLHRGLTIQIDDTDATDSVQLNVDGPDTGSPGWEWYCEHGSSDPAWLPLGDFKES